MKRSFSAVIVALLGIVSCTKEAADRGPEKATDSLATGTPAVSASGAPADPVPPPVATGPSVVTTPTSAPIAAPTATTTTTQPEERPVSKPRRGPLRPSAIEADPSKKPGPMPVGTSQAGRVVRFNCPNGEVPSQVMGGCMCGSEIANPCGPGVRVPDLRVEGKTCLFTCP